MYLFMYDLYYFYFLSNNSFLSYDNKITINSYFFLCVKRFELSKETAM